MVEAALAEAGVALDDVEAVAVTAGPGLIGALLVGVSTAKAIAAPRRLPLIPVDHLQGHVAANFLEPEPLEPPFLCLVASGGHTLLAAVRDHERPRGPRPDPRRRRRRGLRQGRRACSASAIPGGPALQKAAAEGDPEAFEMPVAMARDPGLDFSFSGLKTALVYRCRELGAGGGRRSAAPTSPPPSRRPSVGQLVAKLKRALKRGDWEAVALGGGVAANGPLREAVAGALRASRACG